jgi:hypothetical protein
MKAIPLRRTGGPSVIRLRRRLRAQFRDAGAARDGDLLRSARQPARRRFVDRDAGQFGRKPGASLFHDPLFDDRPDIRAATMKSLLGHLAADRIRPLIHHRLPLADAARAHELLESGNVIGKLLLKP